MSIFSLQYVNFFCEFDKLFLIVGVDEIGNDSEVLSRFFRSLILERKESGERDRLSLSLDDVKVVIRKSCAPHHVSVPAKA